MSHVDGNERELAEDLEETEEEAEHLKGGHRGRETRHEMKLHEEKRLACRVNI